jgi:Ca-activated chloride channel homolog
VGRSRSRTIIISALATLLLALYLCAQERAPVFRVDVKLVRLLATVKDQRGELVGGLDKDAFTIFDNGVRQQVAVFERRTEQPLSVSLLVDTSGSTAKDLRYELDSVNRFLHALFAEGNPRDAVALYSFNYQVTLHNDFTRRLPLLDRNLKALRAEAGTALYDAIYLASDVVEHREGRRVLVIVTDGGDTASRKTYQQALETAHRADAVIYAILVMPITNDAGRNIGGENALTTLTASTGGRVFMPALGAGIDAAFREILSDLRTQYLIGYYPKNVPAARNRFHSVAVKLARPDLRAITRNGYYGDVE